MYRLADPYTAMDHMGNRVHQIMKRVERTESEEENRSVLTSHMRYHVEMVFYHTRHIEGIQ